MKTIACIAEYNPFHLGHLKHFEYIKNTLKADNLIVIMSGNFTQRGEIAAMAVTDMVAINAMARISANNFFIILFSCS